MENNVIKENKKGTKIPILIGVITIIIVVTAIGVGFLLKRKSPDEVYTKVIENLADKMISSIDKSIPNNFDIKNNDISMSGNLKFDTTYDLGEFNALKNYDYSFKIDISVPQKIAKVNLALNEDSKELLLAKTFLQNKKGYLDIPGILPNILDLGKIDIDEADFDLDNIKIQKEDYKILIGEMKNIIISTLDKTKFDINKNVKNNFNGKELSVTEYIYLLDRENQERTTKEIVEKVSNNKECVRIFSEMTGLEEEEIKSGFNNLLENAEYESDIKLVISTSGVMDDVIGFDIYQGDEKASFVNDNNEITLKADGATLKFKTEEETITINCDSKDIKGTIKISQEKENESKVKESIDIDFTYNEEQIKLSLNTTLDCNAAISKEIVTGAKKAENFTEEEQIEIYTNFMNKVKGTSLETLLQSIFSWDSNF